MANGKDIRIEYRNVAKQFTSNNGVDGAESIIRAVENVDLSIADGEVVSIIGPSGCGKSTLLNMGAGLYLPSSGEVFFGLEIQGIPPNERQERSMDLLEKCRLTGFENHYPHQLSGGMRQRAALARTLAVDPKVLLLDEPFSALDAQTKMILQQDLAETLSTEKKTALFITHDLVESVALSDRVFVMSARPGTIIEEIDVSLPDRANPMARRQDSQKQIGEYVAQLMGLLHVGETAAEIEI